MKNETRKQQEQVINEAKAYFDACGLSASFDSLFTKEPVKALIHEKYAAYEAEVQEMVEEISELNMPEPINERVKNIADDVTGKEERYQDDVKISLILSVKNLFEAIETIVVIDDSITGAFKKALESDDENSKIMVILKEICEGVVGNMMNNTLKRMCVPEGMPEDIMDILMMIGGGMPMMNLNELEKMFGGAEDDEDEDEEDDD